MTPSEESVTDFVARVRVVLVAVADPSRAADMSAYMKAIAPFLGVAAPARRSAMKGIVFPDVRDRDGVERVCRALFAAPEREFAYVAVDWFERLTRKGSADLLPVCLTLAQTKSWWDTVDGLAKCAGNLARTHVEVGDAMEQWVQHPNFWVARMAILHQLGGVYDEQRLFRLSLARAHEPEFFIRKAIGWALRDHAWRHPDSVEAFLALHRGTLSSLTIREAAKNLEKARARNLVR